MNTPQCNQSELAYIHEIVDLALSEDLALEDISTHILHPEEDRAVAEITAKQAGTLSGVAIARIVASKIDNDVQFEAFYKDGDSITKGDLLIRLQGSTTSLLAMERTMLNFLQRMSGIATATQQYTQAVGNSPTKIVDTRKTAPGMRITDKMAVRHGGGTNHRMDLGSMVMWKDNHLKLIKHSGRTLAEAMQQARLELPLSTLIEIETTTIEEVKEALDAGADVIMLDNMNLEKMKEAVTLINGSCKTEASGNMTLERIPEVAALGVDYISVGALTHSVEAFDMSMNFI